MLQEKPCFITNRFIILLFFCYLPVRKCNSIAGKLREVAEWSKAHAWKVCIPQKGIEGSNPFLSAKFVKEHFILVLDWQLRINFEIIEKSLRYRECQHK